MIWYAIALITRHCNQKLKDGAHISGCNVCLYWSMTENRSYWCPICHRYFSSSVQVVGVACLTTRWTVAYVSEFCHASDISTEILNFSFHKIWNIFSSLSDILSTSPLNMYGNLPHWLQIYWQLSRYLIGNRIGKLLWTTRDSNNEVWY